MNFTIASHNDKYNAKEFIHYDSVEFENIPEMVTAGYAYASAKFKGNHRLDINYEGYEDVLILDIDEDVTLEQAKIIFKKYTNFIITSKSHQIEKNKIELNNMLDTAIPMVELDANRIEQVLLNLMLNAIKAMPEGGKLVVKTVSRELKEDKEDAFIIEGTDYSPGDIVVIVTIEDTGCGIAEGDLDKLFNPFFASSRSDGGIGLGLYVSRNIMDLHHGIIRINNKEEGGAKAMLVFKV